MPYCLEVKVFLKEDGRVCHPASYLIYSLLLKLIKGKNPEISENIHKVNTIKPITVSALWNSEKSGEDFYSIEKFSSCKFRITALDDSIFSSICDPVFMMMAKGEPLKIGELDFFIASADIENSNSYKEIAVGENPVSEAEMRFVSPCTFKRDGLSYPVPDPTLIFKSIYKKWNSFSDLKINKDDFESLLPKIAINKYRINTRAWQFPQLIINGFTGSVVFTLVDPSLTQKEIFTALLKYAPYSGVGYKTTMGMGQVRVILKP